MNISKLAISLSALAGVVFCSSVISFNKAIAADELVFATAPTQSEEETLKNYQPLVDYLAQVSGKKIVIKTAKSFYEYSNDMRAGKYDLVFDGPHFIKYRIDNLGHVVLAKQPDDLHFVVVVKKDSEIQKPNDLANKFVCTPSIPHLGTLAFLELYPNPARQPELRSVLGFSEGMKCLDDGKAKATVIRDKYWAMQVKNKEDYRIIHTTQQKMPARGMTISSKVDAGTRAKIASALVDAKGNKFFEQAFSTIGGSRFVVAETKDYDGLDELLKVVWGFHI